MTDDERKARNREKTARYRARHRERTLAQGRASVAKWRAGHPAEAIASVRVSYAKHREKYLVRRRAKQALRTDTDRAKVRDEWSQRKQQQNAQRRQRRAADVEAAKRREAKQRTKPGYSERAVARTADWNRKHPEWARALARTQDANRRARERKQFVEAVDPRVVFNRDKGICGICKLEVEPVSPWEIDHIVPISKGGPHSYANVQLAHRACNRGKGSRCA